MEEEATVNEPTSQVVENKQYNLSIFQNIRSWQQQNGMRQNDYQRYRRFCSTKIYRVRRRIGFVNKRGKLYEKMEFGLENVKDAESLFYPLLNAERAWAYANELKEEMNETRNSRIRFHLVHRIKKARAWAEQLNSMCHQLCDDRTALESDAYCYYMKGSEGMENGHWKYALEQFILCKQIFESLGQIGSSATRDLFATRLTELQPILRYCEYNLKRNEGQDADRLLSMLSTSNAMDQTLSGRLNDLLTKEHQQNSQEMRVVNFRGIFVNVDDETLRLALLNCRDAEAALKAVVQEGPERVLEGFAAVFSSFDKCLSILGKVREKLGKTANSAKLSDLSLLFTATKFQKQRRNVERNVFLLRNYLNECETGAPKNLNNLIALASNVVDSLEDLNDLNNSLPSGDGEEGGKTERLVSSIEFLHLQYRALRAMYAAESYCAGRRFDYANTLCLFASQILEEIQGGGADATVFGEKEEEIVGLGVQEDLKSGVEMLACRIKAEALLVKEEPAEGASSEYVSDNLNLRVNYNAAGKYNVIRIPVPMHSVTCKPLFFDLYADHVDYPNMESRVKVAEKKEEKKGWFSGWW